MGAASTGSRADERQPKCMCGRTHEEDRTELLLFVRPHIIPPGESTKDTNQTIDTLTNKDQVKQYLQDPSKQQKEGLIKQLTQ